jgi:hypothetical protein
MNVTQQSAANVVKEVEDKFGALVEIYLNFVTRSARGSFEGIAILGPLEDELYQRLKNALIQDPKMPARFGVDIIRYDDTKKTLLAIYAANYKLFRRDQIITSAPIAFKVMSETAESALAAKEKVVVLANTSKDARRQIEGVLKNEKDLDVIFGVSTFVFKEDEYFKKAAAKAHDSGDGWAVVKVPEDLIDSLEARANADETGEQFNVSGFGVDRKSKELRAVVLQPEAE